MLRVLATLLISLTLAAAASAQLMDKKALTLDGAKKLAAAAEAEATKNNWRVVIVIVDDGGHLVYLERIDDTQTGSIDVAIAKARGAVAYKRPTKVFEDAVTGGRNVIMALPHAMRSEEHTSELQSHSDLVCRLLLEKKKKNNTQHKHNNVTRMRTQDK